MAQVSRLDLKDATQAQDRHETSRAPAPFVERVRRFLTSSAGQLILALLLAVAVRLWVLLSSHGMMDGDEAILGLQAEDILHHGAHPIYFSGQAYMGSWDAYLLAPLIALFGPSAYLLHAVTLGESLLLVPLSGSLAARLFGQRARLPAMLLAALPPEYVVVNELRMLGGYVETLVLGTALLLLAVQIAQHWRKEGSDTSRPTTRRRWVMFGLLMGLGLWIDPLILYYVAAIFLWLLPLALWRLWVLRRIGGHWLRASATTVGLTLFAVVVGAAPALWYGTQAGFANIASAMAPKISAASPLDPDPQRAREWTYLLNYALPNVAGTRSLWQQPSWITVTNALNSLCGYALLLGAIYMTWALIGRQLVGRRANRVRFWSGGWSFALAPLLLAVICIVFWRSDMTAVITGVEDHAGRYALPATTVFVLLLAAVFAHRPALISGLGARPSESSARSRRWRVASRFVAPLALIVLLVAYAAPYLGADNVTAMQSPYARGLTYPVTDIGLVSYLRAQHIRYAWAASWIGNVTMYLDDQQTLIGVYPDDFNRLPAIDAAVAAADRPSFIVYSDPALGEPQAARTLDALGVTYTAAHFGPIWVLTPLSRTVPPQVMAAYLVA